MEIEIELLTTHKDKNITIITAVALNAEAETAVGEARGIARRNPIDRHDRQTAELLAAGRAVQALGGKLLRQADGRVKMLDDLANGRVASNGKKVEVVKVAKKVAKTRKR